MIPVAALAAGTYLLLALALLARHTGLHHLPSPLLDQTIWILSLMTAGAAVWFLFLQLAVVRRWCLYCDAVHLSGLITFVLLVQFASDGRALRRAEALMGTPGVVAGVGLLLLVRGQTLWKSQRRTPSSPQVLLPGQSSPR